MVKKKPFVIAGIITLIIVVGIILRLFPIFWGVFVDKKINLKKSEVGDVNILLMGIGGGAHDGPNLTDTIILVNIQPDKNKVNLISIPRDLYVDSLKTKINAAYATGEDNGGQGILLARSTVESVTSVHPDYSVVMDFSGFVRLVDLLGGIDVQIQNTLNDHAYPTEGKENDLCGVTQDGIASSPHRYQPVARRKRIYLRVGLKIFTYQQVCSIWMVLLL